MKAFITGATGFIGSQVAQLCLERGYGVRCLTRKTSNLQWLADLDVETVEGSLSDVDSLTAAVRDVDLVIHIAGLTAARSRDEFFQGNQIGVRNLVQATLNSAPNVKRFLLVSSLTAVGPSPSADTPVDENSPRHPITTYGESKKAGEDEALAVRDSLPVTIIRPPAVYGPRDTALLDFFKTVNNGILPLIGFGEKKVSLVHSTDLARGIVDAAESEKAIGNTYFISSEEFYTWRHVGDITKQALGSKRVIPLRLPHSVVYAVAGISEFFGRFSQKPPVLNFEKGRDIVQSYWTCSVEAAKRDFQYRQKMSLEDGVRQTIDWYKQHGWL